MRINSKGFTLIELLVVIAIVGLLSTMATVAARYAINQAKIAKAQHAVDTIYSAIVMLGNDTKEWPGHQTLDEVNAANDEFCGSDMDVSPKSCEANHSLSNGLAGLVTTDSSFTGWNGPYMNNIAPDPWGNEYFFDTNYSINENNVGCGCGSGNSTVCRYVVVVGSFGPDGLGVDGLKSALNTALPGACDDVIKIISFNH